MRIPIAHSTEYGKDTITTWWTPTRLVHSKIWTPHLDQCIVLATAHPAKFPSVYENAQIEIPTSAVLESLLSVEPIKYEVGVDADAVRSFILQKLAK